MTKTMAKIFSFGLLVLGLMMVIPTSANAQQMNNTQGRSINDNSDNSFAAGFDMGVSQARASLHRVVNNVKEEVSTIDSKNEASLAVGAKGLVNRAQGTGNMVGGLLSGDMSQVKEGYQQIRQGQAQSAYGALTTNIGAVSVQDVLNADVPILGSVTFHAGDRIVAGTIRRGGDETARMVAAGHGIDQENLSKVSAATGTSWGSRDAITYTTDDGTKINMDANLNATEGMIEGCMPIPVKLDQLKSCIFCPLFLILYNTSEAMASISFQTLAEAFKILLAIGFALYIAFITLKQVSAFTKQDAPKYITEVLTMAFKVLLAWLILSNGAELYRYVLQPLLTAGIEFGSAFLTHQNVGGNVTVDVSSCAAGAASEAPAGTVFYTRDLYTKIDCYLKKVSQEIAVSQSIGSSLMCVARHKASGLVFWDMTMMITGLIMWVFAWLICLGFAFYLIDSVIRLGIIGAITPFLVASWPFKITQGYTKKGWSMFMNAFFTFVFLGLVVSVNVELSAQAATGGEGGVETIMTLVNGSDVEGLLDVMSIGLSGLIFMLLCCVFGFKLCGESATLAGEMGTSGGSGIGSKIGSMAAGAAKGVGSRAVSMGAKGAMMAGDMITFGDGESLNEKVRGGVEGLGNKIGGAIGKGLGKVGIGKFSDSASGQLKNKGMAENEGATPKQSPDDSDDQRSDNPTPDTKQQHDTQQSNPTNDTPKKPSEEAMLDQMIARGGMSKEQEDALLNSAIKASTQREQPSEEAMLDEMIKSGKFSDDQLNDALDISVQQEKERLSEEASSTTTSAKNELSETASQAAESASGQMVDRAVNALSNADNKGQNKEDKSKKDENYMAAEISRLRAELHELKEELRKAGANPTGTNNVDTDRIRKIEEKLKQLGGSID